MTKPPSAKIRAAHPHHRAMVVLPLVILLLIGSASLRLANEAGSALAQAGLSGQSTPSAPPADQASADAGLTCPTDPELEAILTKMHEREARLTDRTTEIAAREATLAAAEARLTRRIEELRATEASLTEAMAKTATAAEDDVATLVAVYAAMKPKDAASLFEAMAPDFAAGFLRRMRPDAAAPIFAGLSPEKAYAVSAVLAGRNLDVPVPPSTTTAGPLSEDRG